MRTKAPDRGRVSKGQRHIMRSTLDRLISGTGLVLAAVLLVGGGMLTWAATFTNNNVHDQLAQQQITMPAGAALATPDMKDALGKYAGQPMTTGDQAKAYADHFILVHMNEASGGKTYAEVSTAYQGASKTAPDAQATKDLGNLKNTLFQGSTLRGLLLNAYAFGTIGKIAGYAAWAAYIGGVLLLGLAVLGLRHAKTVVTVGSTPTA